MFDIGSSCRRCRHTISTSPLIVTISSEPILTGPAKSERVSRQRAFQALVDVEERARLQSVAPDLDLAAVSALRATLRQIAAGAFSLPPFHVPSGPKMLW